MLIQFKVKNFLSFKNEVVFKTSATSLSELQDVNIFSKNNSQYLKSIAIYGPNASGKSNLLKAITFFKNFVFNSYKHSLDEAIDQVSPFKFSSTTENAPSTFEIIYEHKDIKYRYGFTLDHNRIHKEWLYSQFMQSRKRENMLFERNSKIEYGNAMSSWNIKNIDETEIRSNVLLLTKLGTDYEKIQDDIINGLRQINIISGHKTNYGGYTRDKFETNATFKNKVINILQSADIQINDIFMEKRLLKMDEVPPEVRYRITDPNKQGVEIVNTMTKHHKYDAKNRIIGSSLLSLENDESDGTNQLFNLLGPIIDTISENKVLVIDELDSSLHPLLTQFIVKLFNSKANKSAQLIFTTHDATLLEANCLRRDQIWFTEVDSYGVSSLYSLAHFKENETNNKVRKDANFLKQYLLGRYGAIPLIDELLE